MRRLACAAVCVAALATGLPAAALAAFPYPTAPADPADFTQYKVGDQTPSDLTGKLEWMYAATPDDSPESQVNNSTPGELGGVRGGHVVDADDGADTAWRTTTGRPDVTIAVLDSGIKWDDKNAMLDLRRKTRISRGEAKVPDNQRSAPLEPLPGSLTCATLADEYDANGDGVFNVSDYACDSRVEIDPAKGVGPDDLLDPQDVLIAFTDGVDDDDNGFKDDMVGWDFLDDDNDPYDDVQYGHGTGEARDSTAEADTGGELGACPNCMSIHMRVGDSFVADVNRFAQAVIYATDNDVLVVQEALGTLNNSTLARQSVKYAYDHGVAVIASAADEAAQHNNWPSSLPGVILVNSVTQYDEALTPLSRSYLQFTGCTNFNPKVTVAIPSVSCSSDATGRGSGMAGLIYSAALNAVEGNKLDPHPACTRTNGDPCPITANEVRQLMATGKVGDQTQVDDVDFAPDPEVACPAPGCTDPYASSPLLMASRPIFSPLASSKSYPARFGHDQFYGYGRVNMFRAAGKADAGVIPPEVEITSPEWFQQLDPEQASFQVRGAVNARGEEFTCEVHVAPGSYPNDRLTDDGGDFEKVASSECDGTKKHTGALSGVLADVDVNALRARFPATAGNFDGREPGTGTQTSNGRPNTAPYGLYVKVIAKSEQGGTTLQGEDRRNMYLHRDAGLLGDFPIELGADGASSPLLVDLDGDNRNELVLGTSDGFVHAFRRNGDELPGWPVRGDKLPVHAGGRAFTTGGVSQDFGGAFLASPAAGDLDRDGSPEIVAADFEGKVYAWNAQGARVLTEEANPAFSGKPLAAFENVRKGPQNRTQHGFLGSPVLGDLDGDRKPEIVAAGMDRHLYAWHGDGSAVDGYPVLVVDKGKLAANGIDADTHAVTFDPAKAGDAKNQGAIVNTPAIANIAGDDDSPPEIILGTNEEYTVGQGNEGDFNAGPVNSAAVAALQQAGDQIGFGVADANGRVYALHADGESHAGGPLVDGWPVKIGLLMSELLPVVGEGINGSPVVAPLTCPSGGEGRKVGVIPAAGLGYILNGDGSSCQGDQGGKHTALNSDTPSGTGLDVTRFPAVGLPAFGEVGGQTAFVAPVAGVIRALDLAVNEYQGGADGVAAWNPASGEFLPGWPAQVNDLQFLTGPVVADVDGLPGEEVVAGTASMDLQAFGAAGTPALDRLAAADRRLDGGHAAGGLLRAARDRRRHQAGRGRGHAAGHPVRLRERRGRLRARLVASLPPRQRQLRRPRARRRGPGQAGAPGGGERQARLRRAGRRPPLRYRRQVRDRAVGLPDHGGELRRRGRRGGCAGAGRGGGPPPGHAARLPQAIPRGPGPRRSGQRGAHRHHRHPPARVRRRRAERARRVGSRRRRHRKALPAAPPACDRAADRPGPPRRPRGLAEGALPREHQGIGHALLRARRRPRLGAQPARADRPDHDHGEGPPHAPDGARPQAVTARCPRRPAPEQGPAGGHLRWRPDPLRAAGQADLLPGRDQPQPGAQPACARPQPR